MEEVKKHFKMYKAGKHWLVAGIVTIAAVAMGATAVHADTTAQIGSSTPTPAVTGNNSHIGSIQNANGSLSNPVDEEITSPIFRRRFLVPSHSQAT